MSRPSTIGYALLWLLTAWSLLTAAAWLIVHRQQVRVLHAALPAGVACSIVRQPKTFWVLLDATRPEAARAELGRLLAAWPMERTDGDASRLRGLAGMREGRAWEAPVVGRALI